MSNPAELSIGSLEDEAYKRRERIKSLKRKFESTDKSKSTPAAGTTENTPPSEDANDEPQQEILASEDVVAVMESELDTLKEPLVIEDIDITNLAPRKPDWDLKRDVAKKLEILEKRTQRAIAELIRERLKSNQDTVDLQAVNVLSAGGTYSAQD